jgi:ankyrin repeat protein
MFLHVERVNYPDKLAGQTPLYYAARRGHLDLCKMLIEKGADVNHLDNSGKTAVEYARKAKFMDVAEYLNNELKRTKDEGIKMSLQSYSV